MARSDVREVWAKRVERWKDSGLTAKEFATELGVSPHSLSWWKWRLNSTPRETAKARRTEPRSKPKPTTATVSPLTFVEMTSAVRGESIEVVLTTGVRIRLPSDFEASSLERLLGVLERRP
jgi:transposase